MSTILANEPEKFGAIAQSWWDPQGPFKPLHRLNPVRLSYIRDQITALKSLNLSKPEAMAQPFAGLSILDIGCGGGLVAEPMARLGGDVTALDASEETLQVAREHAAAQELDIDYRLTGPEDLPADATFDVVLALEIVEHVDDHMLFLQTCARLVKPGGVLILSTLNRTLKSFLLAKVAAEYIIRWVPRGTHDWRLFMRPSEIAAVLMQEGLTLRDVTGLSYNPLFALWTTGNDTSVNYIMAFQKKKDVADS
jgi:2-polyprenyl-6-hydroxyphenyl methylase/3-demethylubiquinone-9 3-methyltransferase